MRKLEGKEFQMIYDIIDKESEVRNNYHAVIKVLGPGYQEYWLHSVSDKNFEEAAQTLWQDKMCGSGMVESPYYKVYFVSDNAAFVSEGIYGALHGVFDHGHVSFMDMMWFELKENITDALKEHGNWNLNGWTIEYAVEEMVALWQTGSCEKMPWEICDDMEFINGEFNDIIATPKA